jgi:hypothetical protein
MKTRETWRYPRNSRNLPGDVNEFLHLFFDLGQNSVWETCQAVVSSVKTGAGKTPYSCYGRNWNRIDVWAVISYGIQKVKTTWTQSVRCVMECVAPRYSVVVPVETLGIFNSFPAKNRDTTPKQFWKIVSRSFMEMYITVLFHFRVTMVAVKKQQVLHIRSVCL